MEREHFVSIFLCLPQLKLLRYKHFFNKHSSKRVCVCVSERVSVVSVFGCHVSSFSDSCLSFFAVYFDILCFSVFDQQLWISRCVVPPPVWLSFHLLFFSFCFSFFCLCLSFFRVSVSLLLSLSVSACQSNLQLHTRSYLPLSFSLSQGLIMVEMPPPSRETLISSCGNIN